MKTTIKLAVLASLAILMFVTDMPLQPSWRSLSIQVMPDAHAVAGRARRTRRRGVAVGYAAGQSAAQQEQATTAPQQPAEAPSLEYGPLPLGTVVSALPAGCTPMEAGGVQYYHCGDNYFRAAFQGDTLVYVTASPGQ